MQTESKMVKGYTGYGNGPDCGACGYTGRGVKSTHCGWCSEEGIVLPDGLNSIMEFEHVICVRDGKVSEVDGMYAPECYWDIWGDNTHIEPRTGWSLLDGFSGQDRYAGPIMHSSEYIGGSLAEYILKNNGYYVAVVCDVIECDEECEPRDENCNGGHEPAGWAIAYRELEGNQND